MENNLNNRKWKPFLIEEIAEILSGKDIYEAERFIGNIPYASATSNNNGVGYFIGNENNTLESNCISVNRNGSVGYAFFHPYKTLFSNDCRKLRPYRKSRYIGFFLANQISIQKEKYGYGYKMGTARLKKQKILLPVTKEGTPDYEFMEEYMKMIERKFLKEYNNYISLRINEIKMGGVNLKEEKEWKEFKVTKVFEKVQRGKRLKKDDHIEGNIPYASSTSLNNGIDDFIGNQNSVRIFENCLTLANSGSVGCTFYQPFKVVASDHVTMLKNESLNKYVYMFLASILTRLNEKYGFNREINDARLSKEKLLLPTTPTGSPDYEYMEQYMKYQEYQKLKQYLDFKKK